MIGRCRFCKSEVEIDPGDQSSLCPDCNLVITKYVQPFVTAMVNDKLRTIAENLARIDEIEPRINEVVNQTKVELEATMSSQEPVQNAQELSAIRNEIGQLKEELKNLGDLVNENNIMSLTNFKEMGGSIEAVKEKINAKINGFSERLLEAEEQVDKLASNGIALEGKMRKPQIGLGRGIL